MRQIFFKEKKNPNIYMELQRPWAVKEIFREKNKAGGITLPSFKLHYRVVLVKSIWYWHKKKT